MSLPERQGWGLPVAVSRVSGALDLAGRQQGIVEEIARRAANAADDYADYAADHLHLMALAARVPPHLRVHADALVEANAEADLAALARLYRPGR